MLNFVSQQLMEFLYSALFGVIIGMLYDVSALVRLYLRGKKLVRALVDLCFCVVSTVSFFAFLLLVTDGRLRWYVALAVAMGFFIYKNTISGLFFSLIRSIIKISIKVLNFSVLPIYKLKARFNAKGSETESGKKEEKEA